MTNNSHINMLHKANLQGRNHSQSDGFNITQPYLVDKQPSRLKIDKKILIHLLPDKFFHRRVFKDIYDVEDI